MVRTCPLLLGSLLLLTACGGGMRDWDPFVAEPPRPDLGAGADTSSAYAYFALGERMMQNSPGQAADAFYWAARLDPAWADPLYARRMAVFLANPQVFSAYTSGQRAILESPGVQKADSLYARALRMNPFLRSRFDSQALRAMLAWSIERDVRRDDPNALIDQGLLESWIDQSLRRAHPSFLARLAHSEGRFSQAIGHYQAALDRGSTSPYIKADMARALFLAGRHPEAVAMMEQAIEAMAERDEERLVRVYESRGLLEYAIGLIHEGLDDLPGARAAYARALQEDLSYHPAHIRLGELALAEGDTLTAVSQLALAADIQGEDPAVLQQYASMLRRLGQHDQAKEALERAIELEPLFALPYLELARVREDEGQVAEAAEHYRAFLGRASRDHPFRREAEGRLAQLDGGSGGEGRRR